MANVSRRYARALLDVAVESKSVDRVGEQLRALSGLVANTLELSDLLNNPAYTRAQRRAVLDQVMATAQVTDPAVVNLVHLLLDRDRAASLPAVAAIYGELSDAQAGRVRGEVTSAKPLGAGVLAQIEAALHQLTHQKVSLSAKIDPSLLGGVVAQVGSVVYDGSLKFQLEEMRRVLKQA